MTTTDRDGLSAVQIAKIRRIELARFQKPQEVFNHVRPFREIHGSFFRVETSWNFPLIGLLLGIALIICAAMILVHNRWLPGTELYTRLPNLDAQTPSITIYAK
jgi:hypothetical protein